MRRFIGAFVFLGLIVTIPALALAGKGDGPQNAEKIVIAHLADQIDQIDEVTQEVVGTTYYYNVIEVSPNSQSAHMEHGDVFQDEAFPDGTTFTGGDKGEKIEIYVELLAE